MAITTPERVRGRDMEETILCYCVNVLLKVYMVYGSDFASLNISSSCYKFFII